RSRETESRRFRRREGYPQALFRLAPVGDIPDVQLALRAAETAGEEFALIRQVGRGVVVLAAFVNLPQALLSTLHVPQSKLLVFPGDRYAQLLGLAARMPGRQPRNHSRLLGIRQPR